MPPITGCVNFSILVYRGRQPEKTQVESDERQGQLSQDRRLYRARIGHTDHRGRHAEWREVVQDGGVLGKLFRRIGPGPRGWIADQVSRRAGRNGRSDRFRGRCLWGRTRQRRPAALWALYPRPWIFC